MRTIQARRSVTVLGCTGGFFAFALGFIELMIVGVMALGASECGLNCNQAVVGRMNELAGILLTTCPLTLAASVAAAIGGIVSWSHLRVAAALLAVSTVLVGVAGVTLLIYALVASFAFAAGLSVLFLIVAVVLGIGCLYPFRASAKVARAANANADDPTGLP